MGKIGSIIGQGAIAPLRTRGATKTNANPWLNHVLEIFALFMFLGIFTTLCIKETARKTLEELAAEPVDPAARGSFDATAAGLAPVAGERNEKTEPHDNSS
jgi:MFS transporter, PHS family, inorganic phosphate transporter